mmetsp:Transcript_8692/g.32749  ORF Transcript_8692/g.32749 Transcript_8692/m.32749 type:complete len:203 (+) Transcript_8692:117-725(+)
MVDPGPFPVRTEFPSLAPTQAPFAAPEPEGAGAEDLCGERCALWVTVGALAAVLLIGVAATLCCYRSRRRREREPSTVGVNLGESLLSSGEEKKDDPDGQVVVAGLRRFASITQAFLDGMTAIDVPDDPPSSARSAQAETGAATTSTPSTSAPAAAGGPPPPGRSVAAQRLQHGEAASRSRREEMETPDALLSRLPSLMEET